AAPGYLALTAGHDLIVGNKQADGTFRGSISDGFAGTARGAALSSGSSFSYGFTAGNDIVLQPGTLIRTGTGDISLSAGRDLRLGEPAQTADTAAVLYTAGRSAPTPGYLHPPAAGEFPIDGGDVDLAAGRDILAPYVLQATSAWLFRFGDTSWGGDAAHSTVLQQGSWSIVFKNFEQEVGALGGGDVRVRAGRDI